jgi:hypothetical protein
VAQAAVAPGVVQRTPQPLQFAGSLKVLTSQPLAGLPSQSAKPTLQVPTAQRPLTHDAVALGTVHRAPHPPQLSESLANGASQPLLALLSQSPKPAEHAAIRHWPSLQAADEPGKVHRFPHVPQCAVLVARVVSQPLAATPSQSAKPALQVPIAQPPAAHTPVALGSEQSIPHEPQLRASTARSTSQPSVGVALQSARPVRHAASSQRLAMHAGTPPGVTQRIPQTPQCSTTLWVLTSHPVEASMSQSAKPVSQAEIPQRPMAHAPVACVGEQGLPQAPQ